MAFIPNAFSKLSFLPASSEPWIRVAGILILIIGFYYCQAAKADLKEFLILTIMGRLIFFIWSALLVVFGLATIIFIVFGSIDLLTAFWTRQILKAEGK